MIYALDAEAAVIGCCLIDDTSTVIDSVAAKLSIEDISPSNKPYFDAMFSLYADNSTVDIVTVGNKINITSEQRIQLATYAKDTPTVDNYYSYIKIIKEKTVARNLYDAANKIVLASTMGDELSDGIMDMQSAIEFSQVKDEQQAYSMKELLEEHQALIEKRTRKEVEQGISTGFTKLDSMMCGGIYAPDLIIIAARPSMGKSSLMVQIATAAANQKKNVRIYSLEMSRMQLMDRLVSQLSGVNHGNIRTGNLTEDDYANLGGGVLRNYGLQLAIDDSAILTIAKLRHDIKLYKPDMVVVDYLQLMQASTKENRTQQVSELSRGLKLLAKEFNIPVVCLSQLSRAATQRGSDSKEPQLSDLRDGGSIEQDADIVMFIHKNKLEDTTAKLIIAKNRSGEVGNVHLDWCGNLTMFREQISYPGLKPANDKRGWSE